MKEGKLFIFSGASGVGKSTVLKLVMAGRDDLQFSVSATTRPPRPGEEHGVQYYFVSTEQFKEMIEKYQYPVDIFDQLAGTIERLRKENPEIVIGNHPSQNCTLEKREWMLQHPEDNPFIDFDTWKAIIDQLSARRQDFLRLGY